MVQNNNKRKQKTKRPRLIKKVTWIDCQYIFFHNDVELKSTENQKRLFDYPDNVADASEAALL